jgi:hypothetical protein
MAEAARLARIIRADPSSAVASAIEGWDHPVSRETAVLMDLWDLEAAKSGMKKPPRYTRPWKTDSNESRGKLDGRSREEVEALLNCARGGAIEAPL